MLPMNDSRALPQLAVFVRASLLVGGLIAVNILLWVLTWRSSRHYGFLLNGTGHSLALLTGGAAWLAYGFGLRHAVDADHIAAIDNTTRKLMQEGRRPAAVGFFFSLGHSTVVLLLCVGLAISAAYVQAHLPQWKSVGATLGTLVSALFLYLIGFINLFVLWDLWRAFSRRRRGETAEENAYSPLASSGLFGRLFRPLLGLVRHSWQMYFVGFLFGLGFDTATEVGILTLSARSGQTGLPLWTLLLMPGLFAAGMCLVDTLDGILMLSAYGWAFLKPARKLFYNLGITLLSVMVAFVIGTYEVLQILEDRFSLHSPFWRLLNRLEFDNFGFVIVVTFLIGWIFAMLVHKRLSARWQRQEQEI